MASHVLGQYRDAESALAAAGRLKQSGFPRPEIISPIPLHGAEQVLGEKKSAIKRFAFFGALFGGIGGFVLAAGTSVLYVHPTGGRPVITFPPYLVIAYEMTILVGILATVIGFLVSARLPALTNRAYAPEAAVDEFIVSVGFTSEDQAQSAETILREAGADSLRRVREDAG